MGILQHHGVGRNASTPVRNILDELDAVQESGVGWTARCPAHDDQDPSLSVGEGADGRVLLYCHAGCTIDEIVDALGLELRHLFVRRGRRRHKGGHR